MTKYDIIIIGGGLSGLSCGLILSKEGLNVCVLEQAETIGGCLQSFTLNGQSLDTGVHYVGAMQDGGILNHYFKYFGILDQLKIRKLDENGFDEIRFCGDSYNYANGYTNFYNTMLGYFPKEANGIKKYLNTIKAIGEQLSIEKLKQGILREANLDYLSIAASDFISECTRDTRLQNVLAGTMLQYAGIKGESTLYHHAMINHTNIIGAHRFVDSTQQVADNMVEQIRKNGGTVLANSKVVSLNMKNDIIQDVTLLNGEVLEAGKVISSIHPVETFRILEKTPLIKKAYISRLNMLANTFGTISVYLIMKPKSFKYFNRNLYLYQSKDAWAVLPDKELNPQLLLVTCQASSTDKEYTNVVNASFLIDSAYFNKWENTFSENRGATYVEFKQEIADKVINIICKDFPAIKESIANVIVTTPLSYRDYTATKDGSAYGYHKNSKQPLQTIIPVRTKVANLYLTGQNLNVHGLVGVTTTAIITCQEILKEKTLIKKIGNA